MVLKKVRISDGDGSDLDTTDKCVNKIIPFMKRYVFKQLGLLAHTILQEFAEDFSDLSPIQIQVEKEMSRHWEFLGRRLQSLLTLGLYAWGFLVFLRTLRPFSRLSLEHKRRVIVDLRHSRIVGVPLLQQLLEAFIYLNLYNLPVIYESLGYRLPDNGKRQPLSSVFVPKASETDLKADVCIIGAGAGGAVVARKLSEKGLSVILLEEGPHVSMEAYASNPLEATRHLYREGGFQMAMGWPPIILPTGSAVGGTTIINSGTCFRLPDTVLRHWQKDYGLKALSVEAMKPYFDQVEKDLHVSPVTEDIMGENSRLFRKGLERLGLKGEPLRRNAHECKGAGHCCFGCPNDAKQSVNLSYIPQAILAGTKLLPHCRAEKISKVRDRFHVEASLLDHDGSRRTIRIDSEKLVLAAGTLQTPYLLQKNNFANGHPHLGRHLSIHPALKVVALFDQKVKGWEGVPQGYSYHGHDAEGIHYEGIFTPPAFSAANLELTPSEHHRVMRQFAHSTTFGFMVTDSVRGRVFWNEQGQPFIWYNLSKKDLARIKKGLSFAAEVFLNAGAREVFIGHPDLPIVRSLDELKEWEKLTLKKRHLAIAAFHPLGTCRMGTDWENSIVNANGEHHRVPGLFIADGSIFPTPLGVNPQETIMAFAMRIADHIYQKSI